MANRRPFITRIYNADTGRHEEVRIPSPFADLASASTDGDEFDPLDCRSYQFELTILLARTLPHMEEDVLDAVVGVVGKELKGRRAIEELEANMMEDLEAEEEENE